MLLVHCSVESPLPLSEARNFQAVMGSADQKQREMLQILPSDPVSRSTSIGIFHSYPYTTEFKDSKSPTD